MLRNLRSLVVAAGLFSPTVHADSLEPMPRPVSLGQPPRVQLMWGPIGGYDFERDAGTSRVFFDVIGKGRSPQFGIGDQTIEVAAGRAASSFDFATSIYVKIPLIHAGVEWTTDHQELEPSFSARYAVPRGGLFRNGDLFRLDWRPWKNEVMLGMAFNWPLQKYRMNRPRETYVELPHGKIPKAPRDDSIVLSPGVLESLDRIAHAVLWMDRFLTPKFDAADDFEKSAEGIRRHIRDDGHSFASEDATYHRELIRAFTTALDGDEKSGDELAAIAESVILEEIVIPFNRLFAQNKSPHHLGGYSERALAAFADSLRAHPRAADALELCQEIFRRVVVCLDVGVGKASRRWKQGHLFWLKQARLVWLPLNYGLRPEQYDTQAEWDALIAALTEQEWSHANTVEYLLNNQFHLALKRMIRDTERYQVMIIHDFRGQIGRETDTIGWDVVVDGYLQAFTEAIRAVDRGLRSEIPRFFIFLDEHYYSVNDSRPVISFLENLWTADDVDLRNEDVARRVNDARRRLVEAARSSRSLQHMGEEEFSDLFRIHVSVTNQFDPAFTFDSLVRDHRKLAFRDVTESDPAAGEGIFTGQGVGEHYNGPAWEDRSLAVKGPALISLKTATRKLFLSQGFEGDEVPPSLAPHALAADWEQRCRALRERGWTTPVLTTMNDTGYGDKESSVLKAAMYNLLPAGGFLLSLDSLWISDYWAGMFIAAALRGGHLYPLGPAAENAPSSVLPVMVLMHDTLEMMVRARGFFRDEIESAGGSLRVGLYDHEVPVHDLRQRVDRFLAGRDRYPFLDDLFPLDDSVLTELERARTALPAGGVDEDEALTGEEEADVSSLALESEHKPFIHLKGHLLASRSAMRILERPEWLPVLRAYLDVRRLQVQGLPNPGVTPRLLGTSEDGSQDLLTAFRTELASLPPDERESDVFLLTVGSQNQDRLSMLSNGEVLVAVSGHDALVSLTDFMFIIGTAAWPEGPDELEEVFPKPGGLGLYLRKLFHALRDMV